jgi:hypothetical protein
VQSQMNLIVSDPAAGLAHATAIIAAINTAAAGSGFGNNVVSSSAADVAATLTAPDTVTIALPPAPTPSGSQCTDEQTAASNAAALTSYCTANGGPRNTVSNLCTAATSDAAAMTDLCA